jgi:hypothetical protein
MPWNKKPEMFFKYEQKGGFCYGICRVLLEAVSHRVYTNETPESIFEAIKRQLEGNADRSAKGAQRNRRQSGRRYASNYFAMKERVTYIVGCNISIQGGYLTRYAISSYFDKSAWRANHAVLFIGLGGSTIVCDPNWGCGLWKGLGIGSLSWRNMNSLIEGGYKRGPVFATEIEY